ncbi:MFS transporter [Rhizohabitans arisaemae]|uniref:MFS transporter n=1 Tax=Rhizohabitans arisaemae TaxID=2720610 RepID=UPI0024B0F296|nr:MFS transporter [Rhizohabitans arisaemae]
MSQTRAGYGETRAPGGGRSITALLTLAMTVSMLQVFVIGALGPFLVAEAGVSRTLLGFTTTAGFGAAALLSLAAGGWVDRLGARRCLVALLVVAALALTLIGLSAGSLALLAAVAVGGLPMALANPATNKIIIAAVEPARRGGVTGWKQSGVPLGAFVAGVPLAALAAWTDWRNALWAAAGLALLTAVWAVRALPSDHAPQAKPTQPSGQARTAGHIRWLAAFSLLLGAGTAAVNTYLALFGTERLGLVPVVAAWLVALVGTAGVIGRVGWANLAGRRGHAENLLAPLTLVAAAGALLLATAPWVSPLVWVGAAVVGSFAVPANAVTMLAVIQRSEPGRTGRDTAIASGGFFAGFAVGPPLFGLLVDQAGYSSGWLLVAAEFTVAAAIGLAAARRTASG